MTITSQSTHRLISLVALGFFSFLSVTTQGSSPQTTVQTADSGEKNNCMMTLKMAVKEKGHHDSNI